MDFVHQPMLTCIGNKRKMLGALEGLVNETRQRLGKERLDVLDAFAGSTVVSRMLTRHAHTIVSNDLEYYSALMLRCYLIKPPQDDRERVRMHIDRMNDLADHGPYHEGLVATHYAPKVTEDVKPGERCFYTRENALRIDTMRKYIADHVEPRLQPYCLSPLLVQASIRTNTGGVFKGFYKKNGVGHFGGSKETRAIKRIMGALRVPQVVWSDSDEYTCTVYNEDANTLIDRLDQQFDLVYLDPPYNKHPYGSNYFMMNVIARNSLQTEGLSEVSGIPLDWNRSRYNSRSQAREAMKHLIDACMKRSRVILLSYNDEGILKQEDWDALLEPYQVKRRYMEYAAYRASRNLQNRRKRVIETLYEINR